MSTMPVRIQPLAPEEFTPEQAELVGDWTHLVFSRVMIRNPRMYRTFVTGFLTEVIARTGLPPRDRQIVCVRMLELCGEVYELTHHLLISERTGLNKEEAEAMRYGEGASLTDWDRTVIAAVEDIYNDQQISEGVWKALAKNYTQEQLIELVCLAGCYQTMAMLTKSFGMELEPPGVFESFNQIRKYK